MCEGIGLSENKIKSERLKIQADKVLAKGGRNFFLPTKGGNQEVLCLKLDYVPLWLAKINITPTMEKETPELAEKLMEYQLKAKDVLAAALGYQNPSEALADHVDNEDKLNSKSLLSLGQRGGWLINESGMYSLVLSRKMPI